MLMMDLLKKHIEIIYIIIIKNNIYSILYIMLPKNLKYQNKVESATANAYTSNIAPQNGTIPYGAGQTRPQGHHQTYHPQLPQMIFHRRLLLIQDHR